MRFTVNTPCAADYLTNIKHPRWESLTCYIRHYNFRLGAEIGVSDGVNLQNLLSLNPELKMYGVDSYESEGNELERYDEGIYEGRTKEKMVKHMEKIESKYAPRLRMLYMDTREASEFIPNEHLDFVFLDADHSYEGVMRDIELWGPKVKKNGLMMGHDLNWGSVARAVGENFDNFWIASDNVWVASLQWKNA